ncbi:MAG: Fic family protein [Deltaproteobacteria bacterium]|nr:Fic family protein [Deltaproteobacteria bacterium]
MSDNTITLRISRMVKAGQVRKIGARLYTTNMSESDQIIIRRNLWQVVGLLVPGGVVSFRTALENRPAKDGTVFVTGSYKRQIKLPGLRIVQIGGTGQIEGDMPFIEGLYMASQPRAFLENLAPTRNKGGESRSVGREALERKLADILRIRGEDELNTIRDKARSIATELGLEKEFILLDRLVGTLMRTRTTELTSPTAKAYAGGEPYDPSCIERLDGLRAALAEQVLPCRKADHLPNDTFYNEGFFDAYFSNFIEGTEFLVDEALDIVFHGALPENRPEDAHDILGTYRIVGNFDEMHRGPDNFDSFVTLLQSRHVMIMEGRPSKHPGDFKEKPNQAGSTLFVAPELVRGSLRRGYERYQSLDDPFARALFMMYLVSEVHPFDDGNGRISRAMMNAELVTGGLCRILIPSVFRNEYIASLKRMTHHSDPSAFVRVMSFAQEFVRQIDFTDLNSAKQLMEQCNAFDTPVDNLKLKLPQRVEMC